MRRRTPQLELGVLYLLLHLIDIGITHIPVVTLFTVVLQTLLYAGFLQVPWEKQDVCISPAAIFYKKDFKILILGTLEHAHDMHLYYNMVSYIVKGRALERRYGSANFAFLLLFLTVTSTAIFVTLTYIGAIVLRNPSMMISCAIGFSGVIFALKMVLYKEEPHQTYNSTSSFLNVSAKYAVWVELIMIHFFVPNASFIGHLAGILAGLLYTNTIVGCWLDSFTSSITGTKYIHNLGFYR